MGKFSDHLRGQINRVLTETNFKINYVAWFLFTRAVIRSPHVGQGPYVAGHFINNWMPSLNGVDTSTTAATDPDGAGSIARIDSIVKNSKAFYKKDGFITLSNNLSWAANVEYKGWPKGYDAATGWNWTGKRMIYAPVQYAMQDIREIL